MKKQDKDWIILVYRRFLTERRSVPFDEKGIRQKLKRRKKIRQKNIFLFDISGISL